MANEEMAAYWADRAGPEWVENEAVFDHQLEPFGRAVLAALGLRAGESVLDVGCGFGTTSIDAAHQVGPSGRVVGVDLSPVMIDRARQRARDVGLDNVAFLVADAQVHQFDRPVDTVVSRFGVMFFADPTAAFANLHAVVRPGGRLAFVCWQSPAVNPWALAPLEAWGPHLDQPAAPPAADVPGPFGLADADRTRDIVARAGWTDIAIDDLRSEARLGGGRGIDGAVQQMLASSMGRALRDHLPAHRFDAAMADLRAVLEPQLRGDDVVFPAAAWVVTARR